MAIQLKVNEKQAVEHNVFMYEERLKSPTVRMVDKTPTFVTYYHINNSETTTDAGFVDVASILGHRSPIRFNKIKEFPLYGLEQIQLQLGDEEQGLDTNYEGECIILPSTIKPLQNDMFIITYLEVPYIFRITSVDYDTIMPDNFYKINFKLDYVGEEYIDKIEAQLEIDETSVCLLNNIGTDTECIIKESDLIEIEDIKGMYDRIVDFYIAMFYNERHNVLLAPYKNTRYLYDPMQTIFVNSHKLFNEKDNFRTLMFTDQTIDNKKNLKYARSVYRYIELRRDELLTNFQFSTRPGITVRESSFHRWHDKMIDVLDIPDYVRDDMDTIFSDDFKTAVFINAPTNSEYGELIKKYVRRRELKLKDVPRNLDEELLYLNNSIEVFFFTPIVMYITREIVKSNTENKKRVGI